MVEILTAVSTSVLSGVILTLYRENKKLRNEKKQKETEQVKNEHELILGVARILLNNLIMGALERGHTTQSEYEVIDELYKPYIKYGGNGVVKHLFEDRYKTLKVK